MISLIFLMNDSYQEIFNVIKHQLNEILGQLLEL